MTEDLLLHHALCYCDDLSQVSSSLLRELLESTGFFYDFEIAVALELLEDARAHQNQGEFRFLFAFEGSELRGYVCYGPIACTQSSFDLYWIAVSQQYRGHGLGSELMKLAEQKIRELGGTRVYVETAGRAQYASTRKFYEKIGYQAEACLKDFYSPGDDKIIYFKNIAD